MCSHARPIRSLATGKSSRPRLALVLNSLPSRYTRWSETLWNVRLAGFGLCRVGKDAGDNSAEAKYFHRSVSGLRHCFFPFNRGLENTCASQANTNLLAGKILFGGDSGKRRRASVQRKSASKPSARHNPITMKSNQRPGILMRFRHFFDFAFSGREQSTAPYLDARRSLSSSHHIEML